jgi:hypothetical protein
MAESHPELEPLLSPLVVLLQHAHPFVLHTEQGRHRQHPSFPDYPYDPFGEFQLRVCPSRMLT